MRDHKQKIPTHYGSAMRPQQIKRKEDLLPREVLRYTASLSEVRATQANTSINTSKSLASQQV